MKKLILIIGASLLITACGSNQTIVRPLPPTEENSYNSKYRKTKEVILVECQSRDKYNRIYSGTSANYKLQTVKDKEDVSVVETVDTGERFEVYGCYGKPGHRFKISY